MPVTTRSQRKEARKCLPIVKGFKLMGKNMRGYNKFRYQVGKTYSLPFDQTPIMCRTGFHFCEKAVDCLDYVGHLMGQRPLRLFEVEAKDVKKSDSDGEKRVAHTITITKEIFDLSAVSGKIVGPDGVTRNYVNSKVHSENDEPSIVSADKTQQEWCKDGKRHRDGDKPAVVTPFIQEWWVDGSKIKTVRMDQDGNSFTYRYL